MKRLKIFVPVMILLLVAGCTVRFLSEYDLVTDTEMTRLAKEVDAYLVSAMGNIRIYAHREAPDERIYDRWQSEVQILISRAESIPLNSLTVQQLKLLSASLSDLHAVDVMGFETVEEVKIFRATFDSIFRAILKLEHAKKREG